MSIEVGCKCGWSSDIEMSSETNPSRCPKCGETIYLVGMGELLDTPLYGDDGEYNQCLFTEDRVVTECMIYWDPINPSGERWFYRVRFSDGGIEGGPWCYSGDLSTECDDTTLQTEVRALAYRYAVEISDGDVAVDRSASDIMAIWTQP